jgi:hypothetical protein
MKTKTRVTAGPRVRAGYTYHSALDGRETHA